MEIIKSCEICGNTSFSEYLKSKDYFYTHENYTIVKCDNCEFLFVTPRPDKNEIIKYYKTKEYISHSNIKKGITNKLYHFARKLNHKTKYKLINKYVQSGAILDIGCATGEFLNYFKKLKWTVLGIEPDDASRSHAIKQYKIDVFSETKLDVIEKGTFDVITMWHVIEHVHNINERVQQLYNLLKYNGIAVIAVPNINCYDACKYQKYWAGFDLPRHLYHFSKKSLIGLFQKHNFKIIDIYPLKFDAYYISLLSEKYKNGKKNIFNALINGLKSNMWAKKNRNEYSSLIFVFKKTSEIEDI